MELTISKKRLTLCRRQATLTALARVLSAGCQRKLTAAVTKTFCAFVVGLLAFVNTTNAANWFVRPSSQGSANGTNWNNAWSITNLNANWTSVAGGDTVWFAGGSYTTGVNLTRSGTAGSIITLKRATANDSARTGAAGWSSGFDTQVVIAPSSDSPMAISNNNIGYVTIDGNVDSGSYLGMTTLRTRFLVLLRSVVISTTGVNHITVQYCDLAGPGGASGFNYQGDNAPV